jgi:hypothetical protein
MARGNESHVVRRVRASRSAGLFPLVAAVMSAAALTGAAYYTVAQANCADPARYIRHDNHVELIGGCVNTADLPAVQPSELRPGSSPGFTEHGNYRP